MLTRYKTLLLSILLIAGFNTLHAQSRIETAIQQLDEKFPQEKIYLLRSKKSYVAGEDVWFKALVFDGQTRSVLSSSLHLVLYNAQKKTVLSRFIPLADGEGQGDFHLPDSLPEGVYYLRTYTEWMLNFDEQFQYLEEIKIFNPTSSLKIARDTVTRWTAAAFPEGGNFIEGINTKVAIRLQSTGKLPDDWSGWLIEKNKPEEKISSFQSLDPNVGFFYVIPEKNAHYQVVIEDKQSRKQVIDLPETSATGLHMQVNLGNGIIHYALRNVDAATPAKSCFIAAVLNNRVIYKANANINASGVSATIPTKGLESGIVQLLVFDASNSIIAQRLCFINSQLLLPSKSASFSGITKAPREQFNLVLPADTTIDHYSVAILDAGAENPEDEETLYSSLWLSSDLPSKKIHDPASYFRKPGINAALDALMITEQWQRYSWQQILNNQFPEIRFKPQPFISYRGFATISNQPAANIELNLIFKFADSSSSIQQVLTDDKGAFELSSLLFEDNITVYYQFNAKNINKKNLKVSFESLNHESAYQRPLPASGYVLVPRIKTEPELPELTRAVQAKDNYASVQMKIKELETVVVKGKKKTPTELLNENLSTPMFRRNNEIVFDMVNDNKTAVNYMNVFQYLNGRVPGMQVIRNGGDWIPLLRGRPATIYLNETAVDISLISSLPMSEIAMVKVTRGVFSGTSGADAQTGGSGAVLIYTHKGDTRPPTAIVVGLNNVTLKGFDKTKGFPVADYTDPVQRPLQKDTRDLLYWNPFWYNDSNPLQFFNNDDAKNIRVIMIGFPKGEGIPVVLNEVL